MRRDLDDKKNVKHSMARAMAAMMVIKSQMVMVLAEDASEVREQQAVSSHARAALDTAKEARTEADVAMRAAVGTHKPEKAEAGAEPGVSDAPVPGQEDGTYSQYQLNNMSVAHLAAAAVTQQTSEYPIQREQAEELAEAAARKAEYVTRRVEETMSLAADTAKYAHLAAADMKEGADRWSEERSREKTQTDLETLRQAREVIRSTIERRIDEEGRLRPEPIYVEPEGASEEGEESEILHQIMDQAMDIADTMTALKEEEDYDPVAEAYEAADTAAQAAMLLYEELNHTYSKTIDSLRAGVEVDSDIATAAIEQALKALDRSEDAMGRVQSVVQDASGTVGIRSDAAQIKREGPGTEELRNDLRSAARELEEARIRMAGAESDSEVRENILHILDDLNALREDAKLLQEALKKEPAPVAVVERPPEPEKEPGNESRQVGDGLSLEPVADAAEPAQDDYDYNFDFEYDDDLDDDFIIHDLDMEPDYRDDDDYDDDLVLDFDDEEDDDYDF